MALKKKTVKIVVEYTLVHKMVMRVEPDDVDYQVEIIGSTLSTHGTSNYKDVRSRDVTTKKIAYKYSKSGIIT